MIKTDFSKPVLIQSDAFPEVYLRLNGEGIHQPTGSGAGSVSCQNTTEPTGQFLLHSQNDGTYTLESVQYPGVYLRMDGSGIGSFVGSGAGFLNCQFGASTWERFRLKEQSDGSYAIESFAFPNVFLRMDGNNPSGKTANFGTVNCQFGVGAYEKFHLINLPEFPGKDKLNEAFGKFRP